MSALVLLVARIQSMFRRLACAVMGHQTVMHFEPHRLALRCVECGHETPGWNLGEFMPRAVPPQTREKMSADNRAA
jgi:ribosomal protein S27E